ncbi:hypothetical protein FMUND_5503 [Fusarium mundagurra]|uniref:Fungal N-terminal domain-containing protein n=1 Tax=Fusarium mundagurra TaxID=1567541 RepID=A0A8H6DIE3_9HYPO|nr:hypothetical protein FMUND_5503 [Fusarium mundagurra]
MEPISLAFEITSLSMQLVAMVKTIKGLVTAYKSAAQELEELCIKLDGIETICDCLGATLSHASCSTPIPELSPLLSRLKRSIQDCYGKVSTVNQVIEEISANLEPSRNPFKNIGGLFLRYRPQLATYVGSLERSHSTLRDMINAMTFLAFLQKTQISRIQDMNASNAQPWAHTQESSTFTFGSSLLSTYIQLSIMRGPLAPLSVRLQIPRVLLISEDATGVGESVRKAFDYDDLQAAQSLFNQGVLTPATIVTYTEYNPDNEASLLGLAISFQSRKILNFLKDRMDLSERRNHVARFSFPYRYPASDEAFNCILEYIHLRKALMTPAEFGVLLWTNEPRRVTAYVETCRQYFPYDWDRFDDVILSEVSYHFSLLSVDEMSNAQLEDWAPLFRDIVARSQGFLTSSKYRQFTGTVWYILWHYFDPDDAWYRVCRWVDTLELAHVDVSEYLKASIKYCSENWVEAKAWGFGGLEHSAVRRTLRLRYHKGRMLPYWIEYADDSCPIRELLTEFSTLRYMDKEIRWGYWSERTEVYKQWNSGSNLDASHFSMIYWPVIPSLNRFTPENSRTEERPPLADLVDRECELQERRFERKEHRRHQKLIGRGKRRQRIPGAPSKAFCAARFSTSPTSKDSRLILVFQTSPSTFLLTMDPVSLSFGIVSLAMQLVQTAQAVKEYIAAYKSAAKELESLVDKLDDIETICCSLEIILADEIQGFTALEVNLLKKLSRIIQQCVSKVSDIHSILDAISRTQKNTRNPLKTVGALFLRYRDQIRLATDGLDRCLSSLQLHMTANILYSTPSLQPANMLLILQGCDYDVPKGPRDLQDGPSVRNLEDNHLTRRKSSETVAYTWRQAWSTNAFVQWTRKTTKEEVSFDTSVSTIHDDSIFTIGSSLLNLYVKVSLRRGSLSPFCINLQIPRVIYLHQGQRQIGEKIECAFMDDNLGQIKTYFTQGILTPATVIAWDEYDPDNETSLLGLAALTKSQSILKFLAAQPFDLSNRNHIGSARYLYAFNGGDGPRCVLEYIKIRRDSILASEFHMILRGIEDPCNAQICVEACKPYFSSNMVAFNTAVWTYAMKQFKYASTVNIEGWAGLIADCVFRGLDIHQQLRYDTDFSALKDILFDSWDTDEILENMHRWIDIVEQAGVSVKEYLMVETECCFATWRDTPYWNNNKTGSSNYRRVLFIKESRGRQFPFWALSIQGECPVKELLTEHEHFATPLTWYPGGSTQAYIV